ncbi:hypothetical protein ASPVEDRAFT_55587 [Aspergillus versicolor CBS 583.65]|uniref:N-acetyltransferase domain-containing protein n=1 Tax=Aspergillus versicolor CBS 583.65 TaxID=1036611 RepID=A0A1L9PW56_ASPVE|nr:uncharacterized protein ASPVEDRAFT_55587 [Aspergillus versicolor CBS 583.65]OJJ05780.1 hypothetical protein ASPVEDRAFT_55587 [Aspergillus versicolor CBS 583.65]
MTAPKLPCWNCRSDKQKPKCSRCTIRDLDCIPVERKTVFRRRSKDQARESFAVDQTWVNSEPRKWRKAETVQGPLRLDQTATSPGIPGEERQSTDTQAENATLDPISTLPTLGDGISAWSFHDIPISGLDALVSAAVGASHGSPFEVNHISPGITSTPRSSTFQPLANVEEACLLRYFIEELSPWFDHCDSQSHFRVAVPLRAHHCLTLRNAIFAVSSRHLSRLPQFKTPRGIVYHGQLLPDLSTSSAVEYMLKCIPGLLSFHTVQDPHDQENLMAAAIILRQYEEMEEEMEEGTDAEIDTDIAGGDERQQRVNFLAVTQTIIYSMISSPLARSSLAIAAYWIAIRQEVYYALTRKRAPRVAFTPEDWSNATIANMMIMHAGEVAKWCWGDKSFTEYERLKQHQQQLLSEYSTHLLPILQKPADKSKGEIFPTVWYTTDEQVTGAQHLELARMILIAENPRLREPHARAAHRQAEARVRSIVLTLCGIAVDNVSRRMPALVNAVISIMLYGEYFTKEGERDALRRIIDRTKDMHAWPLRRPYERLCGLWEMVDSVEVLPILVTRYKVLRLTGLQSDPGAFTRTYDHEVQFSHETWTTRLLNPLSRIFVAVFPDITDPQQIGFHDSSHEWDDVRRLVDIPWLGQLTLIGPAIAPDRGSKASRTPWELFKDIDFGKAAEEAKAIPPGSRVVYTLVGMYVLPEGRGAGNGRRLVEAAITAVYGETTQKGVDATVVVLVAKHNHTAKRLYERVGFVAGSNTVDIEGEQHWALAMNVGN